MPSTEEAMHHAVLFTSVDQCPQVIPSVGWQQARTWLKLMQAVMAERVKVIAAQPRHL